MRARRDRIENAADIAEGVTGAWARWTPRRWMWTTPNRRSAADLIDHASLRCAPFASTACSPNWPTGSTPSSPIWPTWCSACREVDDEGSVEDLDAINGRIHELGELTRRWGPTWPT